MCAKPGNMTPGTDGKTEDEMSEIIGMSNRVMVMCDGRITGFIDGKDATQENIMALATQFETAPDAAAANQ